MGMFIGGWILMTSVAMVPATLPAARLVAATRGTLQATLFLAVYASVWIAFGAAAYLLLSPLAAWAEWLGASFALAAAAAYELSPLKDACLRRCRTPARILLQPVVRGGVRHAVDCGGCCAFLMGLMLVLGLMSVTWSLVLAAVVLVQKAAPFGDRSPRVLGALLAAAAVAAWI